MSDLPVEIKLSGYSDDSHFIEGVPHGEAPDDPLTAEIKLPGGDSFLATITMGPDGDWVTILKLPEGAEIKVRQASKSERGY